jgi:hypothetical protein
LRYLNRGLLILLAREDPLYKGFKKAFPRSRPVDLALPGKSRDAVEFMEPMEKQGKPRIIVLCTITPHQTASGLVVDVKVEKCELIFSNQEAYCSERTPVSESELETMAEEVPTRPSP